MAFLQRRQGDDTSDAIRRLVRRGLESELSELYLRGEISLRHAADLLSLPVLECLDLFCRQGVTGNSRCLKLLTHFRWLRP